MRETGTTSLSRSRDDAESESWKAERAGEGDHSASASRGPPDDDMDGY